MSKMKPFSYSVLFFCFRYGSRVVSMKTENEVVLVGGISGTTGEVFTQFKVNGIFLLCRPKQRRNKDISTQQ